VQRTIDAPNGLSIGHAIQTDAAINHGNSGGPLIDSHGDVIGINAQISTGGSQGNVGIGFAIPINTVKTVTEQLIKTGKVQHPYLGVSIQEITPDSARLFGLPVSHGLLVENVYAGSPAAKAGIKGGSADVVVSGESYVVGGDVITAVDGLHVSSETRFRDLIASKKPGDTVRLQIYRSPTKSSRGPTKLSLDIKLGRLPATTPPSLG
jgi:S1-C subfamily serine protease